MRFATQRSFEPHCDVAFNMDASLFDFNQLMMLAIERALAPPVFHRRSVLQPMRIVVVDPTVLARTQPQEETAGRPFVLPRALPPALETPNAAANQFRQRAVRGEILSDEQGRLYEKLGRQIRPINQLASGPFGEVIDLVPVAPAPQQTTVPTAETNSATAIEQIKTNTEEKSFAEATSAKPKIEAAKDSASPQANGSGYRKLFADPGQWRVVWWGEFKEILADQLAHPERLRDTYRLPCYVQVIETERPIAIEELATIYKSENKPRSPLYMLTDELAAKLDLILPLRPAPARGTSRPPNTLLAHERVFRLVAANDPTIDVATVKSKLQSPAATDSRQIKKDIEPTAKAPVLKDAIPSRFLKEWEFKLSREEALYDMNAKPTLGALLLKAGQRLNFLNSRKELRKWQTLLAGKSADEQLWEVRPPKGLLGDSFVRNWAERTLELSGYDSRKMITEWEIFWRRKGF